MADNGAGDETSEACINERHDDNNKMNESALQADQHEGQKLSKHQLKRLKKKQHTAEMRPVWRKKQRENRKKRYAEAREIGLDMGPSRKLLKYNTMEKSNCDIQVVIDCSFDHLMVEKDIIKLGNQLQRCYSVNRRMENPLQLYVGSFTDQTKARLDAIGAYQRWDVHFRSEDYTQFLEKDSIVYLTSESQNVLSDLDPCKAYIIGGLVDHNKYKGLCHRLAEEKNISHAQLPIGKFIEMKGRKVLTVDHVFEIIARFTETRNWEEAFFAVIPKRKEAMKKTSTNSTASSGHESGTDGDGVSVSVQATGGSTSEISENLDGRVTEKQPTGELLDKASNDDKVLSTVSNEEESFKPPIDSNVVKS